MVGPTRISNRTNKHILASKEAESKAYIPKGVKNSVYRYRFDDNALDVDHAAVL